jgi:MoaA/NifB/PqqE/SkfB family radical SAM enzyme
MQKNGIAFFNIEGGEPFLVFDRLRTICENIDLRSEIWINSTGNGITYKKLKVLKQYNVTAIMLSMHHHLPDKFNKFMGNENAWKNFVNAIKLCNEVGIPVALNVCLLKHSFYNTDFQQIMEFAKLNNICYVQLIKPKPSGGWLKSGVEKWYKKDLHYIKNVVNRYNGLNKYKLYPPVSAQIIEEDKTCFGCTAGGTDRFYLNAKGDLQPCEFLNISYGNVMKDNFEKIYSKMRKDFFEPNQNWICEISSSQISNICLENNLSKLPLSPDLSKKITEKFKNDNKTEFYKKL